MTSVPQAESRSGVGSAPRPPLRVAILGGGTVGSQVTRLIFEQADDLSARIGAPLELVGVAVRDLSKAREGIPSELLSDDPRALVAQADLVIEVMGGIEPAKSLILEAMRHGASVVTANKALLASEGAELHDAADQHGVDLYYEASVAGAIPLLRPLRESLAGDRITRVLGIVNGTTNYMLTKMDEQGADYDEVLAEAQRLGYAEADPTADVGGHDAAAKAAILATLAFHSRVTMQDVHCEGITQVTARDVASARALGYVIKLLAIAEQSGDGVVVRVHPALVSRNHPLAGVREAFNAVFVEAEAAGQVMFYGRGAGGAPTASAVLGDVVAAGRNKVAGSLGFGQSIYAGRPVLPVGEARTQYLINIEVEDRPGVLATVAATFAEHGVSIQTVRQDDIEGDSAGLLISTHKGSERQLAATVDALRESDQVRSVLSVLRVEGE